MRNHSRKECWLWSHSRPGLSPSAAIPRLCDFDQSCFISVSLNSGKHGLRSAQMYLACSGCSANTNILSCSRTHQEVPRRSSFGFQHPIHILFPPTLGALKPARLQKGRGLFIPITFPSSLHPGSWPKAREPLLPALRFQVNPLTALSLGFLVWQMGKRNAGGYWLPLPVLRPFPLLYIIFFWGVSLSPSQFTWAPALGLTGKNQDIPSSCSQHLVQGWAWELSWSNQKYPGKRHPLFIWDWVTRTM